MVAGDATFTTSFSPDGSASIEHTESVPDGETWYVDNVVVYSDGGHGSDVGAGVLVGAFDDDVTPAAADVDNGLGGNAVDPNDTNVGATLQNVGEYLSDAETFYVADDGTATSDATYHVVVHARRVL